MKNSNVIDKFRKIGKIKEIITKSVDNYYNQ